MEQIHFKMICFFLRGVLVLQLINLINQPQFGADASHLELHDRMTKIEAKNLKQDSEISLLKMATVEDKKKINELKERVVYLEESTFKNLTTEKVLERSKRPVRLLPPRLFYKERNETEELMKRFYGPPHNCRELGMLGYTLNGYYLVKGKGEFTKSKVQTVYCQFKQPPIVQNGTKYETLVGEVDIKSSQVLFSAGRVSDYGKTNENILYEIVTLNIGNGFDFDNQWFSAPYPGSYFFSISGSIGSKPYPNITIIYVKINGDVFGQITGSKNTPFGGFSYQIAMQLNVGDKVYLFMESGDISTLLFTGWMLDENL